MGFGVIGVALNASRQYIGHMLSTARSWLAHQSVRLPALCQLCGLWFASNPSNRVWCARCESNLLENKRRCIQCALAAPATALDATTVYRCGACSAAPLAWQSAQVAVDYAFPWAGVIAQFKYKRHTALARPLAGLITNARHCNTTLRQADVWLGVPISQHKLGERGFNQTHLLLDHLANQLRGCAGAQHWPYSKGFVTRNQQRVSQMGLGKAQRMRNLRGAFALSEQGAVGLHGKHVLLFDDVYTTGATLVALANVVQQAQPASLHVCVLARTPAAYAHNEH